MCKYCNYDIPLHYLLNDAPLLNANNQLAELDLKSSNLEINPILPPLGDTPDAVNSSDSPGENDTPTANESESTDLLLEELSVIDVSVIEDVASNFQIPDAAFGIEIKGDRQYSAVLAGGEELPDWIKIDAETGTVSFEAEFEEIGDYQILVKVQDGFGQSASSILLVDVRGQEGVDTLLSEDQRGLDKIPEENPEDIFEVPQETVPTPQISIDDARVTDSSVGRELTFTISLDAASDQTITVDYATADRTAVEGKDYISVSGTVTFEPGETEQAIIVNTTGTSFLDPDESFDVNLINATNATIKDSQGEGTIIPAYGGIRGGSRRQEVVTFSFFNEDIFGQGGYDGSTRESNAKEPSEVVKENYRQIFAHLNTFVEREFVEVTESESETGDIRIVVSDGPDYAYAGGHIHLAGWAAASDAGINGWESPQGVYAYSALLHELGHAIGMPHSFGRDSSVFDPEENASNTVMSYTYPGNGPATFMSYDIKSLQERYGAAAYRQGDTVYEFVTVDNYLVDGELAINTTRRLKQTLWDSGGIDTFDFSGLALDDSGYRFDLNQSKYQTTQAAYKGSSYSRNGTTYYVPKFGTSIAIDVEIENLINSSSDDLIIANPAANTFSGYGLGLTTGDDILVATNELDTLDLSEFSFFDIARSQVENDLIFELGLVDSITIEDYFSVAEENRINILLDEVEVLIGDVSIVEGGSGSTTANFTVSLDQVGDEVVKLDYTTVDGNAKAGEDYTTTTGTVTFNPGETSQTIVVEIQGDTKGEADETFGVNLLGNYGQVIAEAEGIITNDDGTVPLPTLSISDTSATSGNNAARAIFTVSLDQSPDSEITVDYATVDNVAVAGQDYEAVNGTLTFAPGETEKTVEVEILNDNPLSRDEDFKLKLSNVSSNATIVDAEGIGNILDSTLKIGLPGGTETDLQLASYPPDLEKDPTNLPFEVDPNHNSLTIIGDGNGWKEIPLGEYIGTEEKPLNPYSVIEFDFKTTESGKLHGIHFEGRDHHDFYAPWEQGRFFQLAGSGEFGIQDFNDYEADSLGEWKTYQLPVHQYFDTTNYRRFGEWIVFAHKGSGDDSNSQFRNLQIKELLPISVAGVTVNESAGVATFTLTIPEVSDEAITVDYETIDNTAVASEDYTADSGRVTFAPGETSQTVEITINDDTESEAPESFGLNLSNASNAIAIDSEVIATIEDNEEPLPEISVADIRFDEGNTSTSIATVTVNLSKSSTESISVNYSTEDNTAIAEEDYQSAVGTITFAPGKTSKTVGIKLFGDALNEADENFTFNLADATNATIADGEAIITIANDDALPGLMVEDTGVLASIPVRDGNGNIKNTTGLQFKVTLDAPSNQIIAVDYATVDGTALAGEDYTTKNRTLTFNPGETEKTVFVDVTLDDTEEADEELSLVLSNAQNATITDNQAVGTIEETRSLSVGDLEISEDGTEALFTVSLDKPSVQGVFVNYATEDGTAEAGADYSSTSGRLFIKAGEASATIAVPLIDNKLTEEDETFTLKLSQPKYVLVDDAQGQATILNDDDIPTENPGGIYQGLQFWLKPDSVLTDDDNRVQAWQDISQAEIDLGQETADSRPTLETNGLNYNPVISFDGNDDTLTSLNELPAGFATGDASIFIVSQSDRTNQRSTILAATPDNAYKRLLVHLPYSGKTYFDRGNINRGGRLSTTFDTPNAFQLWNFQTETGVGQSILRNGNQIASDMDTSESFDSTGKTLELSSLISSDAFAGDIAEVIVFNQALNESDRNSVDSYLGIKYGFTLDQTVPTNYVTSSGSVIWNATNAGNYKHDIAGIVNDNGSSLNQVQSRSSNDDGLVTIGNATDLDNGEALVWSNNDEAIAAESITLTNGLYHLTRQWQVQETGDVGQIDLSFDLTGLGYTIDNAEGFSLLIDDDEDFSNAIVHQIEVAIDGNKVSFTNVDLQDSDYFTLAVPEPIAPGGITANLQLWLRGDYAVTNDAGKVTQWSDRSGRERDYSPNDVNNQPISVANQFNFNPTVSFDGNDTLITSRENFAQGEVFFVLNGENNGSYSSLLGDRPSYSTSDLRFEQWSNKSKLGITRRGFADYTSQVNSPFNELSLVSFSSENNSNFYDIAVENNGDLTQGTLDVGANLSLPLEYLANGFAGEIAEVIVFDSVLSETDELKLRSNLAIKYGLTLNLAADYVNSDNQVWWESDLAEDYNNDVAGIAKDDTSDLVQVKSRSSNAGSIVTIAAEDTVNGLEDGEALVWGNQDSTSGRIWQVQENQGDVGTVSVSFDLSQLNEQLEIDDYAIAISDNENFTDAKFHTEGGKIEGNTLTFTGVDFNNGEYFTLDQENRDRVDELPVEEPTVTNKSLLLDGTGGIDIEDLTLTEDFTIEAWVKFADNSPITNHDSIISSGTLAIRNNINFYNGKARIYSPSYQFGNDPVIANQNSLTGQWQHYAFVREDGIAKVYLDGVLNSTSPNNWSSDFAISEIGSAVSSGGLNGELDELRIWSTARSASEIENNKNISLGSATPGLERYYQFDNGIIDVTGNSSDAALTDYAQLVDSSLSIEPAVNTPPTNKSLLLDGTGGIDIEDLTLTEDFTIEAWVKFADNSPITNHDSIVSSGTLAIRNNINFYNGKARIYSPSYRFGNDPVIANQNSLTGQWQHYAFVREDGIAKVYLDGVLNSTSPSNWSSDFAISEIGSAVSSGGLNGELDELRIWSTARSASEIEDNKNVSLGSDSPGLERYYQFDNGIIDVTGNSSDTALTDYAQLVDSSLSIETVAGTPPTNKSLLLDGTGGIDIEDLTLTEDFTIEAWVKFADNSPISNNDGIVNSGTLNPRNDINFYAGRARIYSPSYQFGNDPVIANQNSATGQWQHYAFVREDGIAKVYLDGVLDSTSVNNWSSDFTISEIGAGISPGGLNGELDELRIWSTARSASEIEENKNISLGSDSPGLERYYQFDNGIIDVTGNSSDAALTDYAQLVVVL